MTLTDLNKLEYREQVLSLHLLSESEQCQWLLEHEVLKSEKVSLLCKCRGWSYVVESLADCAFRLRDEVVNKYGCNAFEKCISKVADICTAKTRYCWSSFARPINWIQAALLALENKK